MQHVPVLKDEVIKLLDLKEGEKVVDGTLGLGGHSACIIEALGQNGHLYAFEQDERNLKQAKENLKAYESQITYFHDNFRHLKNRLNESGVQKVDAIFLDLGLSSPHVDDENRGFSFLKEGPLDMRFDPRAELTAKEVLNTYPEEVLAKTFWEYGEERLGGKLARKICERRKAKPFETTTELADFIATVIPRPKGKRGKSHPATKIFQALRILVNDELNVLSEVLEQGMSILKVSGRFVVISYHSLEDRIVKQFFKKLERPEPSEEEMVYRTSGDPVVEKITKKPLTPSEKELLDNPRSRSAKLRAYKKLKETN